MLTVDPSPRPATRQTTNSPMSEEGKGGILITVYRQSSICLFLKPQAKLRSSSTDVRVLYIRIPQLLRCAAPRCVRIAPHGDTTIKVIWCDPAATRALRLSLPVCARVCAGAWPYGRWTDGPMDLVDLVEPIEYADESTHLLADWAGEGEGEGEDEDEGACPIHCRGGA